MDLLGLDPMRRARRVALQFLDALVAGDGAVVRRTADLPFVILDSNRVVGLTRFTTAEELDQFTRFTRKVHRGARVWRLTCRECGAITGEEFARLGAAGRAGSPFEPVPWRQVRVVYARVVPGARGQPGEGVYVVVRVAGGRARVLGVGSGDPPAGKPAK
jgi:hypothetical protein